MKAILLAAGQGSRLRPMTDDRPKCMVEVGGRPLLHWQMEALGQAGVKDIVLVRGYCRSQILGVDVRFIDNPRWSQTNMVQSLRYAASELHGDVLIAYTDILYDTTIVQELRSSSADIAVAVDLDWLELWQARMDDPLADAETLRMDESGHLLEIGNKPGTIQEIQGQYIGMIRLSPSGCEIIAEKLQLAADMAEKGEAPFGNDRMLDDAYMTDLLASLIEEGIPVKAVPIHGGWAEVDSIEDLRVADRLLREEHFPNLRIRKAAS